MPTIAEWNKLIPPSKSVLRARAVRARYGFPTETALWVCGVAWLRVKGSTAPTATPTAKQAEAIAWVVSEIKEGR